MVYHLTWVGRNYGKKMQIIKTLLSKIKSFAFRDDTGVVHVNKLKNYVDDLGTLPVPAWDLIDIR